MAQGITLESKKNIKVHIKTIKLSCLIVLMSLLCLFSVLFITRTEAAPLNPNHLVYVPPIDDYLTRNDGEYFSCTFGYNYFEYVVIFQCVIIPREEIEKAKNMQIIVQPYGMTYQNRVGFNIGLFGHDLSIPLNEDIVFDIYRRTIVYDLSMMDIAPGDTMFNFANAPHSWEWSTHGLVADDGDYNWYSEEITNPFNWEWSPKNIVCGDTALDIGYSMKPTANLFLSETYNMRLNTYGEPQLGVNDKRGTVMYTDNYYEWIDFYYTKHAYAQNSTQTQYLAGILEALQVANADNDYDGTVAQSQLDKQEALKSEQQAQDDFVNDNKDVLDNVDTSLETTDLSNYFDWLNNRFFITMLISSLTIAIVFFSLFGGR